jgi:uncharacterized protein (UPF0335 family)
MRNAQSARERLVRIVQLLETLEEEKTAASAALRDAFVGAKAIGYDTATLRVVLRLRRLTPGQRKEKRAMEAIYLAALGMLEGVDLPDEARRRLDEEDPPPPEERDDDEAPADGAAPTPPRPREPEPQQRLPLKDPEEARQEGRDAAGAGKRIYDNPYPAGDPCRAAWDEGWCAQKKSHGMETPAAYQRRQPKPPDDEAGDSASQGQA